MGGRIVLVATGLSAIAGTSEVRCPSRNKPPARGPWQSRRRDSLVVALLVAPRLARAERHVPTRQVRGPGASLIALLAHAGGPLMAYSNGVGQYRRALLASHGEAAL